MNNMTSTALSFDNASRKDQRPWLTNLVRPWWLKNDFHDNVWHVYEERDDKRGKTWPIYWSERLYDGITDRTTLLTDPENAKLLETAQLYAYFVRESDITRSLATVSHQIKAHKVKNIIVWMALKGITSFSHLNRYDLMAFCSDATGGSPGLLDAYRRLNRLYEQLKDNDSMFPLHDKPYSNNPDGINLKKLSDLLGFDCNKVCNDRLWQYLITNYSSSLGHRIQRNSKKYLICDEPDACVLQFTELRKYLVVWNDLYIMREYLPDRLIFSPLGSSTAKSVAISIFKEMGLSTEEGRTETIPAPQLAFLVDRALRWVLIYADELLDLSDEFTLIISECNNNYGECTRNYFNIRSREMFGEFLKQYTPKSFIPEHPDYPSAPWPLAPTKTNACSEDYLAGFGRVLNKYLPIACAIVIAAFTARRHEEILSVRDSNPNDHDSAPPAIEFDEEGAWLWCYIEKTVQDWDKTPCPASIVKAIEVLTRLSKEAREISGDRRLFINKTFGLDEVVGLQLGRYLNEFAEFVGVPLCDDGTRWFFKPHQFRRFFSIIYMHRYEHANLSALSHQLRHEAASMTETYTTELRDGDLVSAAKKEHALEIITEVALGKRMATGPAGEKLDEMLSRHFKRALKDVEILPEKLTARKARQIAERVMDKLSMELVPFKYGYCLAFQKLKFRNAACISDRESHDGPDLAKATVSTCAACPHFYIDQTFKHYWESMAEIYAQCLHHKELPAVHQKRAKEMYDLFNRGLQEYDWSKERLVNE